MRVNAVELRSNFIQVWMIKLVGAASQPRLACLNPHAGYRLAYRVVPKPRPSHVGRGWKAAPTVSSAMGQP
jgi:hypothetical protein